MGHSDSDTRRTAVDHLVLLLATGLGTGRSPWAPGTAGSVLGLGRAGTVAMISPPFLSGPGIGLPGLRLLITLASCVVSLAGSGPLQAAEKPPNVLLIMAADLGFSDLGCYGGEIATPHIDRLAREGVELTQHYVCPMCRPTRASLLTGRHPGRFGAHATTPSNAPVLPDGYRTLATTLRDAGYDTGLFGKWHLGEKDPGMFDVWEGFNSLGGHWVDNKRDGVYKPDQQTDQMIAFIKQQSKIGEPFFAVNGYYPPHDPYTAPKQFYEPYRGKGVPYAGYYAAVTAIDHNVGRLMTALDLSLIHI